VETTLYLPVKRFLEGHGFTVKGELRGCDVVAVRGDEKPFVVIAELKLGFSMELVLQAVDRLQLGDEVWLAVPQTRRGRDRDRRAIRLCRYLGLGLLAVNVKRGAVEVLAEPEPYKPRINKRKRGLLLDEFTRRKGDPMAGGSTRQPIMTAYRQQALACAEALREGPRRPRDLKPDMPDAGKIFLGNVYGWFERVQTGIYRLTPLGAEAVAKWGMERNGVPGADGRDRP
jgi:hypothetical protein